MMHPNRHPAARQQHRLDRHVQDTDSYAFFNLLTGPRLLNEVEALLPSSALSVDWSRAAPTPVRTVRHAPAYPRRWSLDTGPERGGDDRRGRSLLVALAGPSGASGRRCYGDPGRHRGEPRGLPAAEQPEARPGLCAAPCGGDVVSEKRCLAQRRNRALRRQGQR
jgi:hypothetical protein